LRSVLTECENWLKNSANENIQEITRLKNGKIPEGKWEIDFLKKMQL
jgi:hypothetical protein